MNTKKNKQIPVTVILILVYLSAVSIRFCLAILTHEYPTTLIDEPLYISLARSIGTGKGLLYMGQPADFSSILYPLLLSPVFALFPQGACFFSLLQLVSICLMNLSLFPAYALFHDLLKRKDLSVKLSVLTIMLPDFILGGMLMAESIVWPLMITLFWLLNRYVHQEKTRYLFAVALVGTLLFAAKPGQIILALSLFIVEIILSISSKDRKKGLLSILGLVVTTLFMATYLLLLSLVFKHTASPLGLYDAQVSFYDHGLQLGLFFKSLFQYPYFFFLICFGIPFMIPILHFIHYNTAQKRFLSVIFTALLFTIIGTSWTVNRVETKILTIHMRYIAPYVPVFLGFLFIDTEQKKNSSNHAKQINVGLLLTGIYIAACSILWGCKDGISTGNLLVSVPGLAMFRDRVLSDSQGLFISIFIAAFAVSLALALPKLKPALICHASIIIAIFLTVINNIYAYQEFSSGIADSIIEDTAETSSLLQNQEYIVVYSAVTPSYHVLLDANTRESVNMVYINDLYNHTLQTEGTYEPFIPDPQRGTIPTYLTPDTSTFIIDKVAFTHLQLTDDVIVSNSKNHSLYLISIPEDKPWLKSMMGGPVHNKLPAGTACVFTIFDSQMKNNTVTLSLDMELEAESEVIVFDGKTHTAFTLPVGRDIYSLSLTEPTSFISITIPEHNAQVYGYDITY